MFNTNDCRGEKQGQDSSRQPLNPTRLDEYSVHARCLVYYQVCDVRCTWNYSADQLFRASLKPCLARMPASYSNLVCLYALTHHLLSICCADFLNSLPRLLFSYYCLAIAAARFDCPNC